jgi:pectinesterase
MILQQMKRSFPLLFFMASVAQTQENDSTIVAPKDTSFTVSSAYLKAREQYPFISIVKPKLPDGVTAEENIVYCTIGRRKLHLDLFVPTRQQGTTCAAVIFVHGGGWRSGDKSQSVPMAQWLAARGYVTAAVEYRLSTEALYPAAVHDLKAAIRWLRANAAMYNIDPQKIAALGCSAGGQLVALLGTTNGVEKFEGAGGFAEFSSEVQAVVDIDGILDFTKPESRLYDDDPKKPSAAAYWFGGSYRQRPDLWKDASSLFYVDEKTAPIVFINSSLPRFHAGRDEMIDKLKALGIYYEVHTIPDTPHPFWLFHPWFERTCELAGGFLNKVFKKEE